MRRTGPVAALVMLLALTACNGDGSPRASDSPSPTTPAPVTTTSLATASASPTPDWPAGCPSPQALQAGWTVITADVTGGKVSPPRKTYDVKLKSVVRLIVTADVVDEVHLHTYDRHAPTKPGCPAVLDFEAGIPATVEVELEDAGLHLFQVRAR